VTARKKPTSKTKALKGIFSDHKKTKNTRRSIIIVVLLFGIIGLAFMQFSLASNRDATPYFNKKRAHIGFDGDNAWSHANLMNVINNGQNLYYPEAESDRYGEMMSGSVAFTDGSLKIYTKRHCTSKAGHWLDATGKVIAGPAGAANFKYDENLSWGNVHPNACPTDKATRYSTGRVDTAKPGAWYTEERAGTPFLKDQFRIVIRAKLPKSSVPGTRMGLWVHDNNFHTPDEILAQNARKGTSNAKPAQSPYCKARDADGTFPNRKLAEFDILERNGHEPNKTTETTHILCSGPYLKGGKHRGYIKQFYKDFTNIDADWYKKWHIWALNYDGNRVQYFVDDIFLGEVCGNKACDGPKTKKGAKASELKAANEHILTDNWWNYSTDNQEWKLIMNSMVFRDCAAQDPLNRCDNADSSSKVNDSKPFPTQTMEIDYVKVFKH
jgi:hypothetical protein